MYIISVGKKYSTFLIWFNFKVKGPIRWFAGREDKIGRNEKPILYIYIYIYKRGFYYYLFTNVPVNETIDIIINNIYNNPSLSPLKINSNILWKLLLTCTTEVPFYDHLGNIYVQTDGVSMGSVLGPIFSNFYMSDLENRIFNSIKKTLQYI